MKIQEIPLTQADTDSLLAKLKSLVTGVEADPPTVDHDTLQALADSVATFGDTLSFTDAQKDSLWKLSFTMWNRCVDLGNAQGSALEEGAQASLRQAACDILLLAGASPTVQDAGAKVAFLLLKVSGTAAVFSHLGAHSARVAQRRPSVTVQHGGLPPLVAS